MQGATGLTGMYGVEGRGERGPTGPIGPQGIAYSGPDASTGPTGPVGNLGPSIAHAPGVVYALGDSGISSLTTIPMGTTPATLWSYAIPTEAKGKQGLLSLYFDMSVNYVLQPSTAFDYGLYIDDVSLALGPSPTQRFVQTVPSTRVHGMSTLPIAIQANATNLQLQALNATSTLDAFVVSSTPQIVSNVGIASYTTPADSIGIVAYVWGCGGSPFGSNAGGPGGFSFGYYPCSPATTFTTIVGDLGVIAFNSGGGGAGGSGTSGAGGGFSALFLGSSPTSNLNTPLVVAGGGGGCFIGGAGSNFMWVGGGGGGLSGSNSFNLSTQTHITTGGNGGTQTGAGTGGISWRGRSYTSGNGAGGGGYFGGGGGSTLNQGLGGGGGSGYIHPDVLRSYIPEALVARTSGSTSNVFANGSTIMRGFGLSPTTYAHGGGGTGLIVLIPVMEIGTPFLSVDAQFSTL